MFYEAKPTRRIEYTLWADNRRLCYDAVRRIGNGRNGAGRIARRTDHI
jgi:hypothetical protein